MSVISPGRGVLRAFLRRLGAALAILLVIAWLTLFGLILAERGREGLPAKPPEAAIEALGRVPVAGARRAALSVQSELRIRTCHYKGFFFSRGI